MAKRPLRRNEPYLAFFSPKIKAFLRFSEHGANCRPAARSAVWRLVFTAFIVLNRGFRRCDDGIEVMGGSRVAIPLFGFLPFAGILRRRHGRHGFRPQG